MIKSTSCFGVSNPRFDFFLKRVQHVKLLSQLDRYNRAKCISVIPQRNLKNAAADAFERLCIRRHSAELEQLQFVPDKFLRFHGKCPEVSFCVVHPHHRPQYRNLKGQITNPSSERIKQTEGGSSHG